MRKGKGSWAQVGIVSSMLCLCLGLASQTQHSAHTVLELEVLLAQKKIEYIALAPGDPCYCFKIKGQTDERKAYAYNPNEKLALIQLSEANDVSIELVEPLTWSEAFVRSFAQRF